MAPWAVKVSGMSFVVPAGVETDGASIPRCLWRICGHPLQVPRVYAALVHDWLYGSAFADVPREKADEIYRELQIAFGIPAWKAWTEWAALRLFGWLHFAGFVWTSF